MRHTYSFPVSRNTWIILVASSSAMGSTPVTIGFLQSEDRLLESHHGPRVSAPASSPPMQPLHGSTEPAAYRGLSSRSERVGRENAFPGYIRRMDQSPRGSCPICSVPAPRELSPVGLVTTPDWSPPLHPSGSYLPC